MGLHGSVSSCGILVGVLAPGHALGGTMSLDRSWSNSHFSGRAWFADGSRGKDHNSSPTGGALYVGDVLTFPWATTKMPLFKQGDTIGVEINLGRQHVEKKKDGSEVWHQTHPLDKEDVSAGSHNIPRIRFFHNGSLITGNLLLWDADKEGSSEAMPMHVAVCMAEDGDCAQLYEISWTVWPCPHDSYQSCQACLQQRRR